MQLGLALVKQGKKDEALAEFRKARELAPSDADVRANLGLMLARQGNVAEATEQLNEAVRLNPRAPKPITISDWFSLPAARPAKASRISPPPCA